MATKNILSYLRWAWRTVFTGISSYKYFLLERAEAMRFQQEPQPRVFFAFNTNTDRDALYREDEIKEQDPFQATLNSISKLPSDQITANLKPSELSIPRIPYIALGYQAQLIVNFADIDKNISEGNVLANNFMRAGTDTDTEINQLDLTHKYIAEHLPELPDRYEAKFIVSTLDKDNPGQIICASNGQENRYFRFVIAQELAEQIGAALKEGKDIPQLLDKLQLEKYSGNTEELEKLSSLFAPRIPEPVTHLQQPQTSPTIRPAHEEEPKPQQAGGESYVGKENIDGQIQAARETFKGKTKSCFFLTRLCRSYIVDKREYLNTLKGILEKENEQNRQAILEDLRKNDNVINFHAFSSYMPWKTKARKNIDAMLKKAKKGEAINLEDLTNNYRPIKKKR